MVKRFINWIRTLLFGYKEYDDFIYDPKYIDRQEAYALKQKENDK